MPSFISPKNQIASSSLAFKGVFRFHFLTPTLPACVGLVLEYSGSLSNLSFVTRHLEKHPSPQFQLSNLADLKNHSASRFYFERSLILKINPLAKCRPHLRSRLCLDNFLIFSG